MGGQYYLKTLPEAQRTQDIEFIIRITFMTEIKQTNKQTCKKTSKQTNKKQTNKQKMNKQTNNMSLYFTFSYLQYFLKSDLYFIKKDIFWFVGNWFKILSMDDVSCFGSKVGHQIQSDWVTFIATLPWIAILALSACSELVAWSARVTSVKLAQRLLQTDRDWDT